MKPRITAKNFIRTFPGQRDFIILHGKILAKMVKQRRETAAIYEEQNRFDLRDNELAEAAVIEEYLPTQLSEDELTEELKKIIAQVGATSPKEMGKVMGIASKALAGRADGKAISAKVKELLN